MLTLQISCYHPLNEWLLGAANGNQGQTVIIFLTYVPIMCPYMPLMHILCAPYTPLMWPYTPLHALLCPSWFLIG